MSISSWRLFDTHRCVQSDVDDSYPGAKQDIERLRSEQRLYAVHNHDLREYVLYSRHATCLSCGNIPTVAASLQLFAVPKYHLHEFVLYPR